MESDTRRLRGRLPRVLFRVLAVSSLVGLVGLFVAPVALFSHFQHVYAAGWVVGLLLWLVPAVRGSFWRPVAARRSAVALLVAHGLAIGWLWWPQEQPELERSEPLVVVWCNLHNSRQALQDLIEQIREQPPDIVALAEARLADVGDLAGYPYVVRTPSDGNVLFSRVPLSRARVHTVEDGRDILSGDLRIGRRRVRILAAHPHQPIRASHDEELARLTALAAEVEDVVVLTDLNETQWSPLYRQVLRDGGLRDSCTGLGLHQTWRPFPGSPLGLSIDHVLVGGAIAVDSVELMPWIESTDHRPLRVQLSVSTETFGGPVGQ